MNDSQSPFLFLLLLKHGWLLFVIVTCINALILKLRSGKYIAQNPTLKDGYESLFHGYLFYMNLPWLVLGVGMIFGGFSTIFDLMFSIGDLNPFTILFYGSIIAIWLLTIFWIYFRDGAEFLVKHPGVFSTPPTSTLAIKIQVGLMLAGGILGLIGILSVGWNSL